MTDDPEITDPRNPHKRPDIVAELDRYLRSDKTFAAAFVDWAALVPPIRRRAEMVQRARDEIVALRAVLDIQKRLPDKIAATVRAEALEAAAAACLRKARDHVIPIGQDNYHDGCVSCASAIRALKDKGDD